MSEPLISLRYQDSRVRDRLNTLLKKVGDLTPAYKQIGEALLLSTDRRWEQEISPQGIPWKPNSPGTISRKRAQGRILKILQSTGKLRSSITYKASKDKLVVGTIVPYAAKNQKDRPFLGISKQDKIEIVSIIEDHILG